MYTRKTLQMRVEPKKRVIEDGPFLLPDTYIYARKSQHRSTTSPFRSEEKRAKKEFLLRVYKKPEGEE